MAFMIALLLVVGVAVFLEIKVTGTVAELDDAYREMRGGVLDGRDELGTYELAYLAGGPIRVVNTGLAALVSEGRLRLSRGGTLHRVAGAGRPRDKVERELLYTVERHGGQRSVAEVRREVSPGPEVEAVRRRLVEMGLLARDDGLTRVRRLLGDLLRWSRLAWGSAAVAALAIVPVAGRVSADAAFVLFGGAAVFTVQGVRWHRLHRRKRAAAEHLLTYAGRERLRAAQETYAGQGVVPALAFAPVAVFGLSAVDDAVVREELAKRQDGAAACGGVACGGGIDGGRVSGGDFGGDSGGGDGGGSAGCGGCGGGGG